MELYNVGEVSKPQDPTPRMNSKWMFFLHSKIGLLVFKCFNKNVSRRRSR